MAPKGKRKNVPHFTCVAALGADADTTDQRGRTPLHYGAEGGHVDVVALLLAHGAVVGAADKQGATALSLASTRGHKEVSDLLRQHGATP